MTEKQFGNVFNLTFNDMKEIFNGISTVLNVPTMTSIPMDITDVLLSKYKMDGSVEYKMATSAALDAANKNIADIILLGMKESEGHPTAYYQIKLPDTPCTIILAPDYLHKSTNTWAQTYPGITSNDTTYFAIGYYSPGFDIETNTMYRLAYDIFEWIFTGFLNDNIAKEFKSYYTTAISSIFATMLAPDVYCNPFEEVRNYVSLLRATAQLSLATIDHPPIFMDIASAQVQDFYNMVRYIAMKLYND